MNPPKGYRHCVVGELFPSEGALFWNGANFAPCRHWSGDSVEEEDVGYFFFKKEDVEVKNVWTNTPTDIFNKIFPVGDMDFEDCQQYLAAIIERKFTQEEFTKLCKVMAKERIDAIGE